MIGEHDIREAIRPLRFIFWGGLLWILDFTFSQTTNGQGFRFDVLNDTVGTILIAIGVFRLARMPVAGRYQPVMGFVKVMAVLSVFETAMKHFVFDHPPVLGALLLILGMLQLAATIGFCMAMHWLALEGGLRISARSWRTTTVLFVCIYALPLGVFYLAALGVMVTGNSFNINLGPAGLLLLVVFFIPLIHLFVSTSRMAREATTGGEFTGRAFPVIPVEPEGAERPPEAPPETGPTDERR